MPATSEKQKRFMDAAAHNPAFAKKAGVPQTVAKDFSEKSKGLKFGSGPKARADLQKVNKPETRQGKTELFKKGGETMDKMDKAQDKAMIKKAFKQHDAQEHKGGKGTSLKLAKGGAFRTAANGVATKGKTKGTQVVMAGNKGMAKGGKC